MFSFKELQDTFIKLTFLLRGYDYDDEESEGQTKISLAYAEGSQPFCNIADDMSYLWINFSDSETNKQVNMETQNYLDNQLKIVKTQLRTIDVHWTFYGRNIPDIAYIFRGNLLSYKAKQFLDSKNIKIIPEIPECVLNYEEINNVYWNRIDLIVSYYLSTDSEEIIDTFGVVNVELDTDNKKIIVREESV